MDSPLKKISCISTTDIFLSPLYRLHHSIRFGSPTLNLQLLPLLIQLQVIFRGFFFPILGVIGGIRLHWIQLWLLFVLSLNVIWFLSLLLLRLLGSMVEAAADSSGSSKKVLFLSFQIVRFSEWHYYIL